MDQENLTEHKNQEIPQFQIKSENSTLKKMQEKSEIPEIQIKLENSKIEEKMENFQKPQKCDICDTIIGDGNPEILRNHKMIYHEQILRYDSENDRDYFYCKFCTKEFENENSYRNHKCGSQVTKKTILKTTKKVQPSKSKEPKKPPKGPMKPSKEPTEEPMEPSKEPMKPLMKPVEPSKEPLKPSKEPLKPSKEPKKPSKEPTKEPFKPSEEPMKPSKKQLKSSKEPLKPSKILKKSNFPQNGTKLTKVNIRKGTKIGMKKLGKLKLQLPSNACKTCGKRFKDESGAKRHQMFVHDKTLRYNGVTKQYFFHCKFCQIEFKKQVEFQGHQCEEKPKIEEKIFKIPVKLECDICDMEFFSEQKMKFHLAKNHFKCHFCAKIFDTKWYLYDHQETEHGIKKFEKCSLCPDQKFSSKELLQMHSKSEHKIDNGKCICFTLDFEEILVKHWDEVAKSVVPEPSVEYVPPEVFEVEQFCGICEFSTKIYSELERHVLTHPDEIQ